MNVKLMILGTIAALLLSAVAMNAQCNIIRRPFVQQYNPVVVQEIIHEPIAVVKEVVVPIAVPVFVPAFQFQYQPTYVGAPYGPAYSPPMQGQPNYSPGFAGYTPGYVNNGYVGQGYNQPYNQQGYGYGQPSYGFPIQQPMQHGPIDNQDSIRQLAKALLDEMARQSSVNPNDQGPPMAQPPIGTPPVGPPPVGPPPVGTPVPVKTGNPPGLPQAPIISPDAAAPYAIAALQQNCSACHTGPASKGEFIIFAQPGLFSPGLSWRTIIREIEAGRMPPRYSQYRITPDQIAAVRAWLSGI